MLDHDHENMDSHSFFCGHLAMLLSVWSYKFKFKLETHLSLIWLFMLNWIIHESYNHTISYYDYLPSLLFNCHWKPHSPSVSRCLPGPNPRHFTEDNQSDVWGWEVIQAGDDMSNGKHGWFIGYFSRRCLIISQWRNTHFDIMIIMILS